MLTRVTLFSSLVVAILAAPLVAQRPDPLGGLVAEAMRSNLGLEGERLAERRSAADVHEARGLFFPSLTVAARYSRLDGVPNIGDFVNPAYAALNGILGQSRFPTNLDITLRSGTTRTWSCASRSSTPRSWRTIPRPGAATTASASRSASPPAGSRPTCRPPT